MATGRRRSRARRQASLISSIMKEEPAPITTLSPMSPPALDRVVRTCLAKDPDDRWQTARDVGLQLQGIRDDRSASQPGVIPLPGRRLWPRWLPWLIAAAGLAVAVFGGRIAPSHGARSSRSAHLLVPPPPNANFHTLGANVGGVASLPTAAGSPSARTRPTACTASGSGTWTRSSRTRCRAPRKRSCRSGLPTAARSVSSPGGSSRWWRRLRTRRPRASSPTCIEPRGASWGEDGTIVYAPQNFKGLMRVPAAGRNPPAPATELDKSQGETSHRWPFFLPGGKRFLYMARSPDPKSPLDVRNEVLVASLDGKESARGDPGRSRGDAYGLLAARSSPLPPGHQPHGARLRRRQAPNVGRAAARGEGRPGLRRDRSFDLLRDSGSARLLDARR